MQQKPKSSYQTNSFIAKLLAFPRHHLVFMLVILVAAMLLPTLLFFSSRTVPKVQRDLTAITLPPSPTPTITTDEQQRLQATKNKPKKIAQGKQTFIVSGSAKQNGPSIQQVTIDPYDPAIGTTQTLHVEITGASPILTAKAILASDTGEKTYPLLLTAGQPLSGTWSNSWKTTETHDVIYLLKISASDGKLDDSVVLTIR